nr:right-handed parallel beta-helix repeat-containing protein [Amycolatopsis sp. CA-126428]
MDQPFKTVQKAADVTDPGDTVQLMNGTYQESGAGWDVVHIKRSGKPGAPITFEPVPGHHPVIHPVTGWNGIQIAGASFIRIRNLEIAGNAKNIDLGQARQQAGQAKPVFNTNCVSATKDPKSGAQAHDLEITGNHVHHCPGAGISAIDADHVTIDHNQVHANSWFTEYGCSGISILRALDSDHGDPSRYKIRITENTVYDNETKVPWVKIGRFSDGNGIIIDTLKAKDTQDPDYQGRVLVAGNVSFDNGGSGIHSFKSQHVDIVNNTAYRNSRSTNMEGYANIFAAQSTDVRVLNNISVMSPDKPANSTNKNTDVTYDYNIYFGGKKPETMGPHDLVTDPKLTKASTDPATADFRPAEGSPAIDSGTAFDLPAQDLSGRPRKAGSALDRGALELVKGAPAKAEAPAATSEAPAAGNAAQSTTAADPTTATAAVTTEVANASDGKPADGLAFTGADVITAAAVGALALAAGVFLVLFTRRKRARKS